MSGKSYEQAKVVVEAGDPELIRLMDSAEVSIKDAARVAELPPQEQRKIVAGGADAVKQKAQELAGPGRDSVRRSPAPKTQPSELSDAKAAEVGWLLAADPSQADDAIAAEAGCEPAAVARLRAGLAAAGKLPPATTPVEVPTSACPSAGPAAPASSQSTTPSSRAPRPPAYPDCR